MSGSSRKTLASMLIERLPRLPKLSPGSVGALLLVQLGLVRLLASATGERVYVFGRELHWECWFKQQFNFPCPTCGMTRAVLLTLHSHIGAAWQLNPAAPLLVAGLTMLGLALIFLTIYQRRHTSLAGGALHRRIRIATKIYAHLVVAVIFAHWIIEIAVR